MTISSLESYYAKDPFYSETSDPFEEKFNNGVREITILVLLGFILFFVSYTFLTHWRLRDDEEFFPFSREDQLVYSISFGMCCISLAVAIGSSLLLPISTIANEIRHLYPESWYVKWLNSSLINGIWNIIFVCSNICLFVCLPFAYLFCESEGLPFLSGVKHGLIARAKETMVTLLLLCLTVLGMAYVVSAIINRHYYCHSTAESESTHLHTLFNLNFYSFLDLPFIYSCVSFLGVLSLLVCTPIGMSRIFTIVGEMLINPNFFMMRHVESELLLIAELEERNLQVKVMKKRKCNDLSMNMNKSLDPSHPNTYENSGVGTQQQLNVKFQAKNEDDLMYCQVGQRLHPDQSTTHSPEDLRKASQIRCNLERRLATPFWRRTLGYPVVMILLASFSIIALICVLSNVGQLVTGFRSLPRPLDQEGMSLGSTSITYLGPVGVVLEVTLIGYLLITSLVGLYTLPLIENIKPVANQTSLSRLILNCALYIILSSALPLLSKILGITHFDLLGSFSEVRWLGNIYVVLICNITFFACISLILVNKLTSTIRKEIGRRFKLVWDHICPLDYIQSIINRFLHLRFTSIFYIKRLCMSALQIFRTTVRQQMYFLVKGKLQ